MKRSRKLRVGLTAVAASLVVVTAACGSEEASSSLEKSGDLTVIKVVRSPGGQFESSILADRMGYFEEEGLKVEFTAGTGDPTKTVPLLLNDQTQFAQIDSAGAVKAAAEGLPIKMVVSVQNADADAAASDGLLVPPGSDIKSLADLPGKTIGVHSIGSTPQLINNVALEQAGIDVSSVKYVQLPVESLAEAATKGQVDAILPYAVFFDSAKEAGFTAITPGGGGTLPDFPQVLYAASDKMIAENPDIVEKFTNAIEKGNEYANAHPDEVREIDTEMTDMPADYIANRAIPPLGSEFHTDALSAFAQAMKDQGLVDEVPSIDQLVWSEAPQAE